MGRQSISYQLPCYQFTIVLMLSFVRGQIVVRRIAGHYPDLPEIFRYMESLTMSVVPDIVF